MHLFPQYPVRCPVFLWSGTNSCETVLRGIILNLECADMWKTELHNIAVLRIFLLLCVFYTSLIFWLSRSWEKMKISITSTSFLFAHPMNLEGF